MLLKGGSCELIFKLFYLKWDPPCELRKRREKGVFRAALPHTFFLGQYPRVSFHHHLIEAAQDFKPHQTYAGKFSLLNTVYRLNSHKSWKNPTGVKCYVCNVVRITVGIKNLEGKNQNQIMFEVFLVSLLVSHRRLNVRVS